MRWAENNLLERTLARITKPLSATIKEIVGRVSEPVEEGEGPGMGAFGVPGWPGLRGCG